MVTETERIAILLSLENEAFERKAKSSAKAIAKLEAQYDPLAKAAQRFEVQQTQLNRALEKGTIDATKHASLMAKVSTAYDATKAKLTGTTAAVVAMNSATNMNTSFLQRNRGIMQQAGYQVGDFAVQVQGGQSALVAFSQQGSQLLGIFGPMGAVMGAVLSVGTILAGTLLNIGGTTEKTKEKVKTFNDKLNDTEAAISRMDSAATLAGAGGLEELKKQFGEVTQEVSDLALALYDIEKRAALKEISEILNVVSDSISKATANASSAVGEALASVGTKEALADAQAYRAEIDAMQADIDARKGAGMFIQPGELDVLAQMRTELAAMEGDFANIGALANDIGLPPELLSGLAEAQQALEAAQDAGDFSAMAEALAEIRDLMQMAGDTISQDVVDGVTSAEKQARLMAEALENGEDAAAGIASADMSGGIASAANEAARLAQNLGISLGTAARLAALGNQGGGGAQDPSGKTYSGRGGDPREQGGSAFDIQNADGTKFLENWKPAKTSKGGSKKSSKKETPFFEVAENELLGLERKIELLGKTSSETAALTLKHKLLDEAKERGIDLDAVQVSTGTTLRADIDAQAESVAKLTSEYERAAITQKQFDQAIDDIAGAMAGAIINGESFRESMAKIFQSIAYDILKSGIKEAITSVFSKNSSGGGSGILGSIFGSIFGGGSSSTPSFDGGGSTGIGSRSGGIDGKGGFPAILHPNETVIDHTKGQSVSSGGTSISIDARGAQQGVAEQIAAQMQKALPDIVNATRASIGKRQSRGYAV
jgi:hypothetical protein